MPKKSIPIVAEDDNTDLSFGGIVRELYSRVVSCAKQPGVILNNLFKGAKLKASSTLEEYESNQVAGSEQTIRRYLTLTLWLIPVHAYLCYLFAVKSRGEIGTGTYGGSENWSGALAEGNFNMLILAIFLVTLCIWSIRKSRFQQTSAFVVSSCYVLASMSFSYLSDSYYRPQGVLVSSGTLAFYGVLTLVSFLYRAPPYVTVPLYSGVYTLMLWVSSQRVYANSGIDSLSLFSIFTAMVLSSVSWHNFSCNRVTRLKIEKLTNELDRQKRELQKREETDEVTELRNFRTFWLTAGRDYAKAARSPTGACSMILVSIDRLEELQKLHGDKIKDKVLRSISKVMLRQLRTTDVAGRVSDDLLGIFLPETTVQGALRVAESIQADIHARKIVVINTDSGNREEINLTVSLGISEGSCGGNTSATLDTIYATAELALTNAKNLGCTNEVRVSL